MDLYIDNKIKVWFRENKFYQRILVRQRLINDSRDLANEERLDLKLELLIAGRQHQDDSAEIEETFNRRLQVIDSNIPKLQPSRTLSVGSVDEFPIDIHWPQENVVEDFRDGKSLHTSNPFGMESPISDVVYSINIDETDADRTLTEESGRTPPRTLSPVYSESTTDSTGTYRSINIDETRPFESRTDATTRAMEEAGMSMNMFADQYASGTRGRSASNIFAGYTDTESITSNISGSPEALRKRMRRN